MISAFTIKLLKWHTHFNRRSMPWKGEKDPYKIWLSEIILQQTRVEQGLKYYEKFISAFPTVHALANASDEEVFKLWEGLGYYSRCKNVISTARFVSVTLEGKFPDTYDSIKSLKGIGPYTAAAISSFAYNLPYAVVDGNVVRVIARYFGLSAPANHEGKKLYDEIAQALLDKVQPAFYNQAIMDFGAVICKPRQPLCNHCFQQADCQAYKHQWVNLLPVKAKAIQKKVRWFYYFLIEYNNQLYVRKRKNKDIWENLYEFVLQESESELTGIDPAFLQQKILSMIGDTGIQNVHISKPYRQQLTHQTIIGRFITAKINRPSILLNEYKPVSLIELTTYPFPKLISNYMILKEII